MLFLSLLPVSTFVLTYLWLLKHSRSEERIHRLIFLKASLVWSTLLVLSTECLSLFHQIAFVPILMFWITANVAIGIGLMRPGKHSLTSLDFKIPKLTKLETILLLATGFIILLVGLVAWIAPPNSWDALNYHMPRIMFWIQNHSLEYYPTPEFRQLFFQPFFHYVALHFQILTASDRMVDMISWFSFVGCIVGTSLITKLLGGGRRAQILSAFLVATIPTAIVEASGVRLDVISSFWMVTLVAFLFLFEEKGRENYVLWGGLTLGLGLLTKLTMMMTAPAFVIWTIVILMKKCSWKKIPILVVVSIFIILILNGFFFARNQKISGDPMGPSGIRRLVVTERMTPVLVLSNVVRTVADQMGTTIPVWDQTIIKVVNTIHDMIGVDMKDTRNTISASPLVLPVSTHEDTVSDFVQTILIWVSFAAMFFAGWRTRDGKIIFYMLAVVAAFVIVCASIAWNHHLTRYCLAPMILSMIVVGLWLEKLMDGPSARLKKIAVYAIVIILFATSMPYVFKNNTRRIFSNGKQTIFNTSRLEQYFRNDSSLIEPYRKAVEAALATECRDIGLYMGFNHWDYPLWIMFNEQLARGEKIRLEHLYVNQFVPKKYPLGDFQPCAIVSVYYREDRIDFKSGQYFTKVKDFGRTAFYLPEKTSPNQLPIVPNQFVY